MRRAHGVRLTRFQKGQPDILFVGRLNDAVNMFDHGELAQVIDLVHIVRDLVIVGMQTGKVKKYRNLTQVKRSMVTGTDACRIEPESQVPGKQPVSAGLVIDRTPEG